MLHDCLHAVALVQGDKAAQQHEEEWAQGKDDLVDMILADAEAAVASGRVQTARELRRRAEETALSLGSKAAYGTAGGALVEAQMGNYAWARERAASVLNLKPNPLALGWAALALALSGDVARAEAIAHDLEKRFPENTKIQNFAVVRIRAAIELSRGNFARAVELLRGTPPYERGAVDRFPSIYLRGQAELRAGNGKEAAAEFHKILDRPGIDPLSPFIPLARLGAARAAALAGDAVESRKGYQEFFALWKDADADIPVLREAKAEFARLK